MVVNASSTLTNSTIWFVAALCLIVDVRTDVRTYVRTDVRTDGRTDGRTFLPGLLGHLGGDDLKMLSSTFTDSGSMQVVDKLTFWCHKQC